LNARVRFDNVSLRRGGTSVFESLSLELAERRIGIVGNNGSGKSSLLRLINGLLLPDRGTVTVCGYDTRAHRKELPRLAGFLFQNAEHQILFPTAGEEIAFGLREAGVDARTAEQQTAAVLAANDCSDWLHRPVQELSDGQKQRLCIFAVMAMQPQILLLDEPFASLDLPTRRNISEQILAAPQQVIMASHDFHLLARFERIIWLDNGRIVADGAARDMLALYRSSVLDDNELADVL
jgi:biotin transport system ATP-binding protein